MEKCHEHPKSDSLLAGIDRIFILPGHSDCYANPNLTHAYIDPANAYNFSY
jgi:hypothetical protein